MALKQGMWATYSNFLFPVLQMLARANRERLAVLLEEARSGAGGDERYAACLRWDICFSLRVSRVWLLSTGRYCHLRVMSQSLMALACMSQI